MTMVFPFGGGHDRYFLPKQYTRKYIKWRNAEILSNEFESPTHVIPYKNGFLVSDRNKGEIIEVASSGDTKTLVSGLNSPEGIAVIEDVIFVYEGDTGEIKSIDVNKLQKDFSKKSELKYA